MHFWSALIYVERTPVRARLARRAWEYPWSSAAAHCGGKDAAGLLDLAAWAKMLPPEGTWRDSLAQPTDETRVVFFLHVFPRDMKSKEKSDK